MDDSLDFSFSGLKTAVVRFWREHEGEYTLGDIAASFQAAVVDMLSNTVLLAMERTGVRRLALAGGVAANSCLQKRMVDEATTHGFELSCPPPRLCTDNAAMIACAGYYHIIRGDIDGLDLDTIASQPIG
jgi:N6-L-threonylcarbamoyladenine synthase